MSALQSLPITEMLQQGTIKDIDVLRLRNAVSADGVITADEAEALFSLNETCDLQDPAWGSFYVDTLTDHLVYQVEPEGYLTAPDAKRLIDRVAPGGRIARKTDMDLVVSVLERARWSPVSLVECALNQVKFAVIEGNGPLRANGTETCGTIRENEVELVRRILYAFAGEGNLAITRPEAEILFDMNDAIVDAQANAAWSDLFVKAVTNVVMAASGQCVPSREEALRRDAWLMEAKGDLSPLALLSAMVSSSIEAVRANYQDQSIEDRALVRLEQQRIEIITNEQIAQAEPDWLCQRIGRDGHLTPTEAALVGQLRKDSAKMHPDLQAAVERLAQAA